MHEVSLVQGLMKQVREIAQDHQAHRVTCIRLSIGPFSGVVLDSFSFAFEVLKRDDELFSQSRLVIKTPAPVLKCPHCGHEVEVQGVVEGEMELFGTFSRAKCPSCDMYGLAPFGGDDILLLQVEME